MHRHPSTFQPIESCALSEDILGNLCGEALLACVADFQLQFGAAVDHGRPSPRSNVM